MKGMTDAVGLRDIRSMVTSGRRSMPRVQRSGYLDLYMLQKAKERLDTEAALLDKRARGIRKRLGDIRRQMEALRLSVQEEERKAGDGESAMSGPPERGAQKRWKTISAGY